jgi:starch synthase
MQAQRYGALPIAHATGGLVDTIEDGVTGFLFSELSYDGLMVACARAFDTFDDAEQIGCMRRAAMARRFTWAEPAVEYAQLYGRLTGSVVAVETTRTLVPALAAAEVGRSHVRARSRVAAEQALEVVAA